MLVSEGQKLGTLTVLMVSLTFYAVSLFNAKQPVRESPLPWGSQGPGSMVVEVRGGRGEGVYFLPEGTKLDKIREVAGIQEVNDRMGIADRWISDGSLLVISPAGEMKIEEISAARRLALGLPVDLNRASEGDLSLVPGIGERMAAQIVQLRIERGEFRNLSDLMAVPGIKEKKLNGLKDYLIVRRAP
jgi:competence protein ComEA